MARPVCIWMASAPCRSGRTFGARFMTPEDTAKIMTRADLIAFLDRLRLDYQENGNTWENSDLPSFIEAFQAWLGSSEHYYKNQHIDRASVTPWREVADAFAAARIYE